MAGSVGCDGGAASSPRGKFSLRRLGTSLRRTMSFKLDRKKTRNRSHSDIGVYNRELDSDLHGAKFEHFEGSLRTLPDQLVRQLHTLSCPAVVTIKVTTPSGVVTQVEGSLENVANVSDTVKYHRHSPPDPALLHGSTGTFGGSAGCGNSGSGIAKSAPATPLGLVECGVGVGSSSAAASPNPPATPGTITKSPSHHLFIKQDNKENSKSLSSLSSTMTGQGRTPEPPSPKTHKEKKTKVKLIGASKARQKKFHRHFSQVDPSELVLNYYSCALVADILLQGHLYITKNYFAFYSNVFGYVTKLLIPTVSVLRVSKEKTARIIPNAVGITTVDEKHVFGSLLSRESTYNFMLTVWNAATLPEPEAVIIPAIVHKDIPSELDVSECSAEEVDDDDDSSSHSDRSSPPLGIATRRRILPEDVVDLGTIREKETILLEPPKSLHLTKTIHEMTPLLKKSSTPDDFQSRVKSVYFTLLNLPRQSKLLLASTFLLVLLFSSAAFLLYRIGAIQQRYSPSYQENLAVLSKNDNVYNEILKWQAQLHTKSSNEIHTFLRTNLDQIAKIRQSLEALSLLIAPIEDENLTDKEQPVLNS